MEKIPLETCDGDAVIRFRDCFSVRYIQSAALLCRLAFAIEQEYRGTREIPDDMRLRHEAFALNSVLSSVAFLEATINELYADAADNVFPSPDDRQEALLRTIAEQWKNEKNFDRAPLITRYQKILSIAGSAPFEEGDRAFDNVRELVEIRNRLMHYKREWVVLSGGKRPAPADPAGNRFESALKKKFAQNPFAAPMLPFFPDQCLGHGCAEWAIVNSVIFADAFFRKIGLPVPYEGIRDELVTR